MEASRIITREVLKSRVVLTGVVSPEVFEGQIGAAPSHQIDEPRRRDAHGVLRPRTGRRAAVGHLHIGPHASVKRKKSSY